MVPHGPPRTRTPVPPVFVLLRVWDSEEEKEGSFSLNPSSLFGSSDPCETTIRPNLSSRQTFWPETKTRIQSQWHDIGVTTTDLETGEGHGLRTYTIDFVYNHVGGHRGVQNGKDSNNQIKRWQSQTQVNKRPKNTSLFGKHRYVYRSVFTVPRLHVGRSSEVGKSLWFVPICISTT